jgi:capsular polysaccharide export protein
MAPLLRIPPFPGAHIQAFRPLPGAKPLDEAELQHCVDLLRRNRAGGAFWAAQPRLPEQYLLVRSAAALPSCRDLPGAHGEPLLWLPRGSAAGARVVGECDPWHMLAGASGLVTEAGDEVAAIAAVLQVPVYLFDPVTGRLAPSEQGREIGPWLQPGPLADPFTGEPLSLPEAIGLCGFWRRLIDSNRDIAGAVGFAFWKQGTVAPLLWNGSGDVRFSRDLPELAAGSAIAVWQAKAPAGIAGEIERRGLQLVEVEDGFLRSSGLGADCVPPLSVTVDRLGAHFDPSRASELELRLQDGRFDAGLVERARSLRQTIVAEGLGKYERATAALPRPGGAKLHILVPGQVEDDRSILTGGCGLRSNLELLRRVRAQEPYAFILYKPHPDVLAGHRTGDIPERTVHQFADAIAADAPISALLDMVDAVHVNTSLAGFEALLRGKAVTTHGVPFYAGWGLTTDLGPVPARRTARRTVDELVAATLLLYPRYLDPVTGLPCPAETVVRRLCAGGRPKVGVLPAVRRLQGRLRRSLRVLVQ